MPPPPAPPPTSQAAKEALAAAQALLETATVKVVHYRARCEEGGEGRVVGVIDCLDSKGPRRESLSMVIPGMSACGAAQH